MHVVSLCVYDHIPMFSPVLLTDRIHDLYKYFRPHLLGLVDASNRRHLTVFVSSKNLTHGACRHTVGHTVNVDLFFLMDITHRRFFFSLLHWLAAVEYIRKQRYLPIRRYIWVHIDKVCNVNLIMSQVVYWWYISPACQLYNQYISITLVHRCGCRGVVLRLISVNF